MPRRFKILIALIVVAACGWFVWHLLRPRGVFETTYRGRNLLFWARLEISRRETNGGEDPACAIRALCSNNLPVLVAALNYDPDIRDTKLEDAAAWLPPGRLRWWLLAGPLADHDEQRAAAADVALQVLGPEAASVVPQVEQLIGSTNLNISMRAWNVLPHLGSNSVPWLLSRMADERHPQHSEAVHAFCNLTLHLGTNTSPAVIPVVMQCLHSRDPRAVMFAAHSLGNIQLEPATCVPGLIGLLTNGASQARFSAIISLGRFGRDARAAVPELTRALRDPSANVRTAAAEALVKISPEVYTNTPAAELNQEGFTRRYGLPPPSR